MESVMAKIPQSELEATKRIMGVLGRMPPKPHSEMKLGKPRGKPGKSLVQKRKPRRSGAEEN
jgi:hypothetical protein